MSHSQLYGSYPSTLPRTRVCCSLNKCQLVAPNWIHRLRKIKIFPPVCKQWAGSIWLMVCWMHHWAWMVTCWAVNGWELRQFDTVRSVLFLLLLLFTKHKATTKHSKHILSSFGTQLYFSLEVWFIDLFIYLKSAILLGSVIKVRFLHELLKN